MELILWVSPWKAGWEKQLLYNNAIYTSRYAVSLRRFVVAISSFPQNVTCPHWASVIIGYLSLYKH
jgi:hypothetical protein